MIFSDKLTPKDYHYHIPIKANVLKPGERLGGQLIWERRVTYFPQGYWASLDTWRNRLRYKLYRLRGWLAWRECDLFDEITTLLRLRATETNWKDLIKQLWDHWA